ncbi:ribosomal protein S18-alanine N-acetyltransferase [Gynuella sp.]|uniref:ribosomal protein S18-alanine N-acetyltransferase n=1 Tax=Gynuella sp. TaxID=2969146 RepID=UPI003D0B5F3E
MKIRFARPEDLQALVSLDEDHDFPWGGQNITSSIDGTRKTLCLTVDDQITGFLAYSLIQDQLDILHVAIASEYQGRGYGRRLLNFLLTDIGLSAGTEVFLEVRVSNTPAICLYQSMGFNEIGIRKNYYRYANHCEDAIQMVLTLV